MRNRSYTITADVEIPQGGAQGVLLAHGSSFGGYSFFVNKEQKLQFSYNYLGIEETKVISKDKIPAGKVRLASRVGGPPLGQPTAVPGDRFVQSFFQGEAGPPVHLGPCLGAIQVLPGDLVAGLVLDDRGQRLRAQPAQDQPDHLQDREGGLVAEVERLPMEPRVVHALGELEVGLHRVAERAELRPGKARGDRGGVLLGEQAYQAGRRGSQQREGADAALVPDTEPTQSTTLSIV